MNNELLIMLYQKYQKEIYLYLYSLCKRQDLAEDLVQETFLKAILSLSDNHTNMRAWLYLVARNMYFNALKKEKRNVALEEANEVEDEQSTMLLDKILANERSRLLYQALLQIGETKREILMLQYFGNMSGNEIAAVLKISPENVRILSYRGKKELKKYMEENGYEI